MRLRALLPLLSIPAAAGLAVWAGPFAAKLHAPAPVADVPSFKFGVARESLVRSKQEEDEEDAETIDYRVLTPAAYAVADDAEGSASTFDRRPIRERFRLLSVLMSADGSSALVDKRVVRVGDWLAGYRIVSITRDGLDLKGPRGGEHLGFMNTEELALREAAFGMDAARGRLRDKIASTDGKAKEGKPKADKTEAAIPAGVKAQMEQDYQKLLKDFKP